jgi:hypothetical protein
VVGRRGGDNGRILIKDIIKRSGMLEQGVWINIKERFGFPRKETMLERS